MVVTTWVAEDVGITRAGEGVEDTTVVQVDERITGDDSLEGTAIDELTLSHVLIVALRTACHTRQTLVTIQVDVGAVFLVVGVFHLLGLLVISSLTDGTSLTATEDLEHITLVQVDGGAAPDL